jgi:methylenetetrahydrofolate dehydrogenase (NADP+)/methenyltetrahydrofolate cyclohydrolase/formyltetrahydrofolate synthetase
VDGFSGYNIGNLTLKGGDPLAHPCTPAGVLRLLKYYKLPMSGKKCVILGRSNIVGTPLALLMLHADATVTICHSKTKDIEAECRSADIVVAAIGKANYLKGHMIKEGAVVIDVGINVVKDVTKKSGTRLVGDVEFDSCYPKASMITPVPGGVGPMTIAMLLRNTLNLAKRQLILMQEEELTRMTKTKKSMKDDHFLVRTKSGRPKYGK